MANRFRAVKYLSRLAEFLGKEIERNLREIEDLKTLSPSHFEILTFLMRIQQTNMSSIADTIHKRKPTVTVLVQKLEEIGLVKRHTSKDDKRETTIELTKKGKSLRVVSKRISAKIMSLGLWGVNEKESDELFHLLEKVYTHLRSQKNL